MIRARTAAALVSVALVASGCGAYGAALREQEVVVYFKPEATQAVHAAARAACSDIPNVSPEPMIKSKYKSDMVADVRFRIDNASDADLAKLYSCLRNQKDVVGVNIPDKLN